MSETITTIYHNANPDGTGTGPLGLEVRPPMSDFAVEGLARYLTRANTNNFDPGYDHLLYSLICTRNDDAGTALIANPNSLRYDSQAKILLKIGEAINPAGAHTVEFSPPLE
jgi:hypothetical protein